MRGTMIVVGSSGVGGAIGCLAGTLLPGFELASALLGVLGATAGTAAGILLCITAPAAWSATGRLKNRALEAGHWSGSHRAAAH